MSLSSGGDLTISGSIYKTKTTTIPNGLSGSGTALNIFTIQNGPETTIYIKIDITGLAVKPGDFGENRIFHKPSSTAESYLLQWSNSTYGVATFGSINCLETPSAASGSIPSSVGVGYSSSDVDGTSEPNATDHVTELSSLMLTSNIQMGKSGNAISGITNGMGNGVNLNSQYLYLYTSNSVLDESGNPVTVTFTAGKYLIKLFGYDASF